KRLNSSYRLPSRRPCTAAFRVPSRLSRARSATKILERAEAVCESARQGQSVSRDHHLGLSVSDQRTNFPRIKYAHMGTVRERQPRSTHLEGQLSQAVL